MKIEIEEMEVSRLIYWTSKLDTKALEATVEDLSSQLDDCSFDTSMQEKAKIETLYWKLSDILCCIDEAQLCVKPLLKDKLLQSRLDLTNLQVELISC